MPQKSPLALRVLEFLNVVEDDRPRLSWTRIGLILMLGLVTYMTLQLAGTDDVGTIAAGAASAAGIVGALLNYVHQRQMWYNQPERPPRPIVFGRGEVDDPDGN